MPAPALAALLLASMLWLSSGCEAQEGDAAPEGSYDRQELVTAVDLLVEVDLPRTGRRTQGERLRRLRPEDFELRIADSETPIIAIEAPGPEAEPWEIVIYVDALASPAGVRHAAGLLAQEAANLAALGWVRILRATPEPVSFLAPTRDAQMLESLLARISLETRQVPGKEKPKILQGEGLDAIRAGRHSFLRGRGNPPQPVPISLAQEAARKEGQLVLRQQDILLQTLLDLSPGTARRLLILISDGYDLDPWSYYRSLSSLAGKAATKEDDQALATIPSLATAELAQTLAAYGWITLPLSPPPAHLTLHGARLGKWRVAGPGAVREAERRPERAEAYLLLAQTLFDQGNLERAEVEVKRALHHFYRDPRTKDQQSDCYLLLAQIRVARKDPEGARRALANAAALDPEGKIASPDLLHPLQPLAMLAEATSGGLPREARQLAEALRKLGNRVRLTYQITGSPSGKLKPVELLPRLNRMHLKAPSWSRSGTPGAVAAARLRQLLAGDIPFGGMAIEVTSVAGFPGRYQIRLRPPQAPDGQAPMLRITYAIGGEEEQPIRITRLEARETEIDLAGFSRQSLSLEPGPGDLWMVVLVDDLHSDAWAAGALDLSP